MKQYVCRGCGETVTASPFRATCPDCGGRLERRPDTDDPIPAG